MKKRIIATIVALTTLTPVTVKADTIHHPHAFNGIPVKAVKAKDINSLDNIETHWWVFSKGEIHEFLTFEERGTVELGNAYPTVICDCMWDEESEMDNTDGYYCPFAFIPNLDEGTELSHELNKKETRVLWFELGKEFFQIDKNLERVSEGA